MWREGCDDVRAFKYKACAGAVMMFFCLIESGEMKFVWLKGKVA